MIIPSNGRIVWFTPRVGGDGPVQNDFKQPLAAMIVHVWGDRMVNLTVFGSDGLPRPKTSVPLLQEEGVRPAGGYFCEWMPYQKGQAAKAEALEAKLGEKH